jgi:type IV secretory pathway VirB10-like protein
MAVRRILYLTLLALVSITTVEAQEATPNTSRGVSETPIQQLLPGSARPTGMQAGIIASGPDAAAPQSVTLTVPKGTSLQVALEKEVRIKRVGQCVHAQVVEPVYAFDHLVVPVGSKVRGEVTKIEPVSGGKRTLAGLDGDFTPTRKIEVRFTEMVLADGKQIALHTNVTPGSGQVLKFVSAPDKERKKTIKDVASEKTKEAKQQAKDQWNNAMAQLKTPGRIRRLERYAEAQLPLHYQYIPAGTIYFAELEDPLDFGSEPLTAQMAASVGGALPEGSVVHARLLTALSSATAQKGQDVEAVLTRPLFDGENLIYPQGSKLVGAVGQVQPARRMKKNGQLRIAFHQVVLPDGVEQKVQAALVGVEAGKDANVKLDSEGGAEATNSKSRYGSVALSMGLAMLSAHHVGDRDGDGASPSGTTGGRMAGGVGGFKLVGAVMGVMVQSRAFGYAMGAYGAGMSVYRNFMARGHEVVFPQNTAMEIGIGTRAVSPAPEPSAKASPSAGGGQ